MRLEELDPYRGKILVVDDEEAVAQFLQKWLQHEGYYARQALNFDEVRRAMEQTAFDLVTLDIMMPDVDGLQVLKWLKEHYPEVGVLMATAMEDRDTVIEAMRAGAADYLLKPFSMELVAMELERAMERQRLIAENRTYQFEFEKKVEIQILALRESNTQLQQINTQLQQRLRKTRESLEKLKLHIEELLKTELA